MNKALALMVGFSLVSAPAYGQVRPQDCRPVLPVMDDVAAMPADVIAEPVAPATAARRSFFGLPLLLPLLAAAGGLIAIGAGGGGGGGDQPISPS